MARCGSFGTSCGITDGAKISLGLLVRQKLAHSYASSGNRGAIVGCCDRALRLYGGFRFCGAGRTDKEGDQTKGYATHGFLPVECASKNTRTPSSNRQADGMG